MKKTTVALIFGGPSAEHDVSLVSAKCILAAMDRTRFDVLLVGIDRSGRWVRVSEERLKATSFQSPIDLAQELATCWVTPHRNGAFLQSIETLNNSIATNSAPEAIDVVFNIVHGTGGEDGVMQGLLRSLSLPFVGSDVTGSAVCMDKEFTKRILHDQNLPITPFEVLRRGDTQKQKTWGEIQKALGPVCYVKPANCGSSVGVHRVTSEGEYASAVKDAFRFDRKVLVEKEIKGMEVEVAVLGNDQPKASIAGAFRANSEFYDYEAKYLAAGGATFQVPATNDAKLNQKFQELAISAYQALDCRGLSRVDFFLTANNEILINEINTLPGFTPISMYPQLWEKSGVKYSDLISDLIQLAIDEQKNRKEFSVSRT